MAVTASPYWALPGLLGQGVFDLTADTINVMLLADTYTPDLVGHVWLDAVNSHEVAGTGYTAGGLTLTGVAWAYNATEGVQGLTADWATWTAATLTARWAVVYKDAAGVPGDSPLMSLVNFGENKSVAGVDFVLRWAATGVFLVSVPGA